MSLPDALYAALGEVIEEQRREWKRERELMEAERRAERAEWQNERRAFREQIEQMVAERLAAVTNGRDGADGATGRDGVGVADFLRAEDCLSVALTDGRVIHLGSVVGPQGAQGERGEPGESVVGPAGPPGEKGDKGDPGESIIGERGEKGDPGPKGDPGRDGIDGKDGRDAVDGAPGRDGRDGDPGPMGERGPEGPLGRLPAVRAWSDAVHYVGDVVTHAGGAWQAQRDTGREPPHEDWLCIVSPGAAGERGADGRGFTIRGTWSATDVYAALDVVALNGASFAARRDDPGPCPGEGWQMIARQGKPGEEGKRGVGLRGEPGPPVAAMAVDGEGLLTLTNADGSTVTCDLYPLLSRIAHR